MINKPVKQYLKSTNGFIFHHSSQDWGDVILIMEKNGLGFARIYWFSDDTDTVYFDWLDITPCARKKGLGTKLQEIRQTIGILLGASTICLWVKKNTWMHAWYRRRGFEDWKDYENEEDCIWMKRLIK